MAQNSFVDSRRTQRIFAGGSALLALLLASSAGTASANQSSWGSIVGFPDGANATWWCGTYAVNTGTGGRQSLTTVLQRVASDGTAGNFVANGGLTQRARAQCFATSALTGASTFVTSGWSTDANNDVVTTPLCPTDKPFIGFPRCQQDSLSTYYIYAGSPCGNGISSVGTAVRQGQLTGKVSQFPGLPLYNDTFTNGKVGGTDLGNMFFNAGKMYFAFGDSFEGDVGSGTWRSNTLFSSSDFDPTNGITFDGFHFNAEAPKVAAEVIPGLHQGEDVGEVTAIPSGSFAITEPNGDTYRYIWFFSVKGWSPTLDTNYSTIAYSRNGGTFHKLGGIDARPYWSPTSHFTMGAVWYNRTNGWIYLFGTPAKMPAGSGVRVAAVQAKHAFIIDKTKYWYWTGSTWVQDTNGDLVESLPATYGQTANLIQPTAQRGVRGDFSVAYNSFANRLTMLFTNTVNGQTELWQSSSITGPWTAASTGSALPNQTNAPGLYAPLMDEFYMIEGGRDVHFLLSQWSEIYNVAQWKVTLNRNIRTGCTP